MNFAEVKIIHKRNLTPLYVEFTLELPKKHKRYFQPQPGQYITLKISDEKVTQARNYSISKFNPTENSFSIAIKKAEFDKKLKQHNKIGLYSPIIFYFHAIKPEYGFLLALAGLYLFNQLVGLLLEYSYKSKSRVLNLLLSFHIIGVSLLVVGVGLYIWLVFYYN